MPVVDVFLKRGEVVLFFEECGGDGGACRCGVVAEYFAPFGAEVVGGANHVDASVPERAEIDCVDCTLEVAVVAHEFVVRAL